MTMPLDRIITDPTTGDGPDDADVVVTVPEADAAADPAVAFMQGRLKASGHTGVLFEALRSGLVAERLHRLLGR